MKKVITALLLLIAFGIQSSLANKINPILGDKSFIEKYGFEPYYGIDEQERISTHLQYVEQVLKSRDIGHLTSEKKCKRARLIQHLSDYWKSGIFPKNKGHLERKPCFIDEEGNICAVGYLVEQTAGRAVAKNINASFKYATIHEMTDDETLNAWIRQSGLTLEEAAMIQPAYAFHHTRYREASAVGIGLNVGLVTSFSLMKNHDHWYYKTSPYVGLAAGFAQTSVGLLNLQTGLFSNRYNEYRFYDGLNIGIGFSTMLASGFHLYNQRHQNDERKAFLSPSTFMLPEQELAYGMTFLRRF